MKRDALDVCAELAELMEVAVAPGAPVVELDAEFEARLGGADKLRLVDAEHLVVELQGRDGGFPYADRADLIGFDQGNGMRALEACAMAAAVIQPEEPPPTIT